MSLPPQGLQDVAHACHCACLGGGGVGERGEGGGERVHNDLASFRSLQDGSEGIITDGSGEHEQDDELGDIEDPSGARLRPLLFIPNLMCQWVHNSNRLL